MSYMIMIIILGLIFSCLPAAELGKGENCMTTNTSNIPPIDLNIPVNIETATFAMG